MTIRRIRAAAVTALVALTLAAPTSAAFAAGTKHSSTGGTTTGSSPLALTYQYTSMAPNDPPSCLSEDDFHLRTWTGSLNGTFTASDYLCDPSVDYYNGMAWDPGGLGVYVSVDVVGTVQNLAITSPTGVSHPGVLVSSTTSKGVTTNHYEACYEPAASTGNGSIGAPIPGGTWNMTLAGNISSATYNVNVEMGYANWQQQYCPASEQNLVP